MKKEKSVCKHLILTFGLVSVFCFVTYSAVGCYIGSAPDEIVYHTSIESAEQYLNNSRKNNWWLCMEIDLGDLSKPDNNYLRLLATIESTGKNVMLDLNRCTMDGTTVWTSYPLNEAAPGMDRITELTLPTIVTSIQADTNGISPFFFYKNLRRVTLGGTNVEISDRLNIGDECIDYRAKPSD